MATGIPNTEILFDLEALANLQNRLPPDVARNIPTGPGGFMQNLRNVVTQKPQLGPDDFGSYVIPPSDPTYSTGFQYARSIAGGIPMSQVIAPGVSYSPDQPMGYTQEQLNTPIGTTPTTPPPTPPTTPPPPDDPGFFGGIGGVTIPMPPPPPGFFDIFGGRPPSGAGGSGLPEGYSYDRPMDGTYTSVMPSPGMRYAYGPDGDRIEVPDNRSTGGTPPVSTGPLGDLLTSLLGGMGAGTGGTRGPSDAQVGDGMPTPPINVGGPVPIRGPQPVPQLSDLAVQQYQGSLGNNPPPTPDPAPDPVTTPAPVTPPASTTVAANQTPDLSGFARLEDIPTFDPNILKQDILMSIPQQQVPDVSQFVTQEDIQKAIAGIDMPTYQAPDLSGFARLEDIPKIPSREDFLSIAREGIEIPQYQAPDLSGFARLEDIPTFDPTGLQQQIAANQAAIAGIDIPTYQAPDLSAYDLRLAELEQQLAGLQQPTGGRFSISQPAPRGLI